MLDELLAAFATRPPTPRPEPRPNPTGAQQMGTLPKIGTVSVEVAATPEQVWVAPRRHHPRRRVEPRDAGRRVARRRHRGRARRPLPRPQPATGGTKWSRVCEVLDGRRARPSSAGAPCPSRALPRQHALDLRARRRPTAGCRITQRFEVLKLGPVIDRLFYALIPAHRDRSAALAEDVRRLGAVAASRRSNPPAANASRLRRTRRWCRTRRRSMGTPRGGCPWRAAGSWRAREACAARRARRRARRARVRQ